MGLMDVLSSLNSPTGPVASAMASPLWNLGMGLIAGTQPFANPGQEMQRAAANQQQLALNQMRMRAFGSVLGQMMGKQPTGQSGGLMSSLSAAQPPVVGPFSAAPAPSAYGAPSPAQIAGIPVGGLSPQMLQGLAFINGQNPVTTAQQISAQQMVLAQRQYGTAIATLDTAMKAQSPTRYVKADPRLSATWAQVAPSLGFDLTKDFTDANVRTALAFARNRIAGALQEPTVAPPVQMSQIAGPLGSLYQRNPVSNAVSQVKPEEALKMVTGPNGPMYVPASAAAGRPAFSPYTYIDQGTTAGVAKLIANYEAPPLNGYALRTPQGQAIMAQVQQLNPSYDATTYATKQQARERFATGKQGDIVRSLSVATNHLDQLSQAVDAMKNYGLPAANKIANAWGVHTGQTAVTSFNAMKEIVGDEVVKAVVGTSGAESDREAIKDAFDAARSPQQLAGVIQKYKGLMGGQLSGLRRQYEKATGLNDFDSFLSQAAQGQLRQPKGMGALGVGQSATVGAFTVKRIQ